MRLFIAALLPDEIKNRLGEYLDVLKERVQGVRWEKPEKLHITLKFLGNVEDAKAAQVSSLVEKSAAGCHPFQMEISNFGGFPDLGNPRILFVGMSENPALSALRQKIEEALEPLGFPKDNRRFVPHVTIGRIKDRLRIEEALPLPEKHAFTIDEVGVIKSEPRRDGSIYTPVRTFALS